MKMVIFVSYRSYGVSDSYSINFQSELTELFAGDVISWSKEALVSQTLAFITTQRKYDGPGSQGHPHRALQGFYAPEHDSSRSETDFSEIVQRDQRNNDFLTDVWRGHEANDSSEIARTRRLPRSGGDPVFHPAGYRDFYGTGMTPAPDSIFFRYQPPLTTISEYGSRIHAHPYPDEIGQVQHRLEGGNPSLEFAQGRWPFSSQAPLSQANVRKYSGRISNSSVLQNREKSKRHYIRKKLHRSILAEVLFAFSQTFELVQSKIAKTEEDQQELTDIDSSLSAVPSEWNLRIAILESLRDRITPPSELSCLLGTGDKGQLGRASCSDDKTVSATSPEVASTKVLSSISSTPACSSLNPNEKKRLNKMMQRHLDLQRMHQISAVIEQLLRALRHISVQGISFEDPFVSDFAGKGTGERIGGGGGIDTKALRDKIYSLSSNPDEATLYAFIQVFNTFKSMWTDLMHAEIRLSTRQQKPISRLIDLIQKQHAI